MRNSSIPSYVELPSSERLVRSTFIAIAASAAILVAVVLPAEYGVDPTGLGSKLDLTQMGELKMQLAEEAKNDRANPAQTGAAATTAAPETAATASESSAPAQGIAGNRSDEMTITLKPGQGAEVKLAMAQGAKAKFDWKVNGGVVNFDLHGDGGGRSARYEQGKGVPGASGEIVAAFNGNHGWFWRNRGTSNVSVTVRTNGAYADIKRVV